MNISSLPRIHYKANLAARTSTTPELMTPSPPPPPAYTCHSALKHTLHPATVTTPSPTISCLEVASPIMFDNTGALAAYDDEALAAPLVITISAPLTITGHNNLVGFSPDRYCAALAASLLATLREASMSKAGIPMIDEDGRPRPIEVKLDAAVMIDGEKNVVGDAAVLELMRLKRDASACRTEDASASLVTGRKRSAGVADEVGEGRDILKRARWTVEDDCPDTTQETLQISSS